MKKKKLKLKTPESTPGVYSLQAYLTNLNLLASTTGFPGDSAIKYLPTMPETWGSIPGSGKILWRRKWQPTLIFLPRKSHRQWSLAGSIVHGVAK